MKYVVECFNDECLLQVFGIEWYDINHKFSQGKGAVLNILSMQKNRVGMIDYDTFIEHDYFEKCKHHTSISNQINIYFEKNNNNYVIVISPKIESLIVRLTIVTDSTGTAERLGFTNTESNYHNIKSDKSKLSKLKDLLQTLLQKSNDLKNLKRFVV